MINKAELGARSVRGSQGGSQPGSGAPHSLRGSRVRQWGPVQLLGGISHQDTMAKSQAGPSGKYSQLGQQGVLEEGWVVPGEEQALVIELFYQGVGGVTVLRGGKVVVLWLCLRGGLPAPLSPPCPATHRLDHCKLHLPKFVLLHPRLLHHHSSALLGFLGVRREIPSCHGSPGPGGDIPRPSLPPLTILGGLCGRGWRGCPPA